MCERIPLHIKSSHPLDISIPSQEGSIPTSGINMGLEGELLGEPDVLTDARPGIICTMDPDLLLLVAI